MARTVEWAESALDDLDEVLEFIARDSAYYAAAFADEAQEAANSLGEHAQRGRVVPELNVKDVREIFVRSYRMIFQITPDTVYIVAFLHGARDFDRAWGR